jgi:Ribosomal protein S1
MIAKDGIKDAIPGEEVVLNPITEEMIEGEPSHENDTINGDELTSQEQAELLKFVQSTGAQDSSDLPGVDMTTEDRHEQDIVHETISQEKQPESSETEDTNDSKAQGEPRIVENASQPEDDKAQSKTRKSKAGAKSKKQDRVDVGRDLMPEAYTAQEKKLFTKIENWEDVHNAVKTKRLVRAEVTQVNDDDQLITVRYDNIRGIIPYIASGVEEVGRSLVWLVGRTICFVIEKADEKSEGGFFVANRAKGLEALAAEVRKVMKVGSIRQAVVSRIEPWGVWVEMGGVYGRLSKRDISYGFVSNIEDVLQSGNLIDVKITKVSDTGRIQVSLKDALPDPWLKVPYNYKVGSIVKGKITGYIPELIFIEIENGVNTVAPFPRFPVKVGQRVAAKIRWIDVEEKRMSSSIWKVL